MAFNEDFVGSFAFAQSRLNVLDFDRPSNASAGSTSKSASSNGRTRSAAAAAAAATATTRTAPLSLATFAPTAAAPPKRAASASSASSNASSAPDAQKKKKRNKQDRKRRRRPNKFAGVMSRLWAGPGKQGSGKDDLGRNFNQSVRGDEEYGFLFVDTAKKPMDKAYVSAAAQQAKSAREAMARLSLSQRGVQGTVTPQPTAGRRGSRVPVPPPAAETPGEGSDLAAAAAAAARKPARKGIVSFAADADDAAAGNKAMNASMMAASAAAASSSAVNAAMAASASSAGAKRGFRALRIASKTIAALAQSHDFNWGTRFGAMHHHAFEVMFDAQNFESAAAGLRPTVSQWVVDVHRALDRPFFVWLRNWDDVDADFSRIGASLLTGKPGDDATSSPTASAAAAAAASAPSPLFFAPPPAPGERRGASGGAARGGGAGGGVTFEDSFGSSDAAALSTMMSTSKLIQHATVANYGPEFAPMMTTTTSSSFAAGAGASSAAKTNLVPEHLPIQHPHREFDNLGTVFAPTVDNFTYPHRTASVDPHTTAQFSVFRPTVRRFTGELQLGEQRTHLACPTMQQIMATTWLAAEVQRSDANQRLLDVVFCKHERTLGRIVSRAFFAALEGDRSLMLSLAQFKTFAHKAKVGSNAREPWATFGVQTAEEAAASEAEAQAELRRFKSGVFGASPVDMIGKKGKGGAAAAGNSPLISPSTAFNVEDVGGSAPKKLQSPGGGAAAAAAAASSINGGAAAAEEAVGGVFALLPILFSQLCKPYSGLSIASFTLALFFLSEMIYRPAEQHNGGGGGGGDDESSNGNDNDGASSSSSHGVFCGGKQQQQQQQPKRSGQSGVFGADFGDEQEQADVTSMLRYPEGTSDHDVLCDTFVTFVRNHLVPYIDTCLPWYADPDVCVMTSLPRVHTLVDREYGAMLRQLFLLSSQLPVEAAASSAASRQQSGKSDGAAAAPKHSSSSASQAAGAAAASGSPPRNVHLARNLIDEDVVRPEDRRILPGSTASGVAGSVAAANEAHELEHRVLTGLTLTRLLQSIAHTTQLAQRDRHILAAIEAMIWSVSLQHAHNPGKAAFREQWAQGHSTSALVMWENAALRFAAVDCGDVSRASNFSLVEYFKRNAEESKAARPVSVADVADPLDSITICYDGFVEAMCRAAILCDLGREESLRFPTQSQVESAVNGFFQRRLASVCFDIFGANGELRDDLRCVPSYDRRDGLPVVHTVRLVARANLLREGPSVVHFHQVDTGAPLYACIHRALSVNVRPSPTINSGRAGTFVVPPLKHVLRCIAQNGDAHSHAPHTVKFRVSGRLISQASIAIRITYLHVFEISFGAFGHRWVAAPPAAVKESSELSPPFTFVTPTAMFQKEEALVFTKTKELIAASPPGAAKAIARFARSLVCSARRCATAFMEMAVGLVESAGGGERSSFERYCDMLDSADGGDDDGGSGGSSSAQRSAPKRMGPRVDEIGHDLGQHLLGWNMVEKRAMAGGATDDEQFGVGGLTSEASATFFGGATNRRKSGDVHAVDNMSRMASGGGGDLGFSGDPDDLVGMLTQQNTFSLLRRHSLNAESLAGPKKHERLITTTEALDMLVGGEAAKSNDWLLLMRKARCCVPPMDRVDEDYLEHTSTARLEGAARSAEEFAAELMQDVLMTDAAWVARYETRTRHKMGLRASQQQVHMQGVVEEQRARRGSLIVLGAEGAPAGSPRKRPPSALSMASGSMSGVRTTSNSTAADGGGMQQQASTAGAAPSYEHRTRFRHNALFTAPTRLTIAFVTQVLRSAVNAYKLQRMRALSSAMGPTASLMMTSSSALSKSPLAALVMSARSSSTAGKQKQQQQLAPTSPKSGAAGAFIRRPSSATAAAPAAASASSSGLGSATGDGSRVETAAADAVFDRAVANGAVSFTTQRHTFFDRSLILGLLRTAVSTQRPGWGFLLVGRQRVLGAVGMGENGTTLAGGEPLLRIYGFDEVDRSNGQFSAGNSKRYDRSVEFDEDAFAFVVRGAPRAADAGSSSSADDDETDVNSKVTALPPARTTTIHHPRQRPRPFMWTRSFVANGDAELSRALDVACRRVSDIGADRTASVLSDFLRHSIQSRTNVHLVGSAGFHPLMPNFSRTASLLRSAAASDSAADAARQPNACVIYRVMLEDRRKTSGFAPSFLFGAIVETNTASGSGAASAFSGPFSTLAWQVPLLYADQFAMTLYSSVPLSDVIEWYAQSVLEAPGSSSGPAALSMATSAAGSGTDANKVVFSVQDAHGPGIVACALQLFKEHARDADSSKLREELGKRGFIIVSDALAA